MQHLLLVKVKIRQTPVIPSDISSAAAATYSTL